MNIVLRLCAALFFLLFLGYVLRLVSKGRLQLKYSLLWILLCVVILVCDAFPGIIFWFSALLGFITSSNFLFIVAIVLLLAICLSLSVAVSRLTIAVKNLTQRIAILEKSLEGNEGRCGDSLLRER